MTAPRLTFAIRPQSPHFAAMWIAARAKFGEQADAMGYVGSSDGVAYFQLHGVPTQFSLPHTAFGA